MRKRELVMYPVFYHIHQGEEHYKFPVPEGESLLDCLEEALYVLWELTPVKPRWEIARQWREEGVMVVSYHNCEFCMVRRVEDKLNGFTEFVVEDMEV